MKIIDLLEYRRNNTPKYAAIDIIRKYKDLDNVYISFTTIDKLGINPQTPYNTPIGIYSYPLKTSWEYYGMDRYGVTALPFAADGTYIWIFEANVPDIGKMKKTEFDIAMKKIKALGMKPSDINDAILAANSIWGWDACYGAKLWNVTSMFANGNNKKWTKTFLDLGYNGFVDGKVTDIIHENEPVQAVFFTIKAIKILEKIHNISPKKPEYGKWAVEQKNYFKSLSWEDICHRVKQDPNIVQWLENPTDEQIKELININKLCIAFFNNINTDLLKEIISEVPKLFRLIPKKMKTDELCYIALKSNPELIQDDMSEKVKSYAITKNPFVIGHLENPSPALQILAVKLDIETYNEIENPSIEVENYYFQNSNKEIEDEDF
jgi:hypothetical protein